MPDYDRSGCAVVVETVLRILHTDERQATYTYDSPLAHPYLSCEYFTEFHAVSRLAQITWLFSSSVRSYSCKNFNGLLKCCSLKADSRVTLTYMRGNTSIEM